LWTAKGPDDEFTAIAEVALNDMFGLLKSTARVYSRKGEFSMEYKVYLSLLP